MASKKNTAKLDEPGYVYISRETPDGKLVFDKRVAILDFGCGLSSVTEEEFARDPDAYPLAFLNIAKAARDADRDGPST